MVDAAGCSTTGVTREETSTLSMHGTEKEEETSGAKDDEEEGTTFILPLRLEDTFRTFDLCWDSREVCMSD
jgi:hypothetical protein